MQRKLKINTKISEINKVENPNLTNQWRNWKFPFFCCSSSSSSFFFFNWVAISESGDFRVWVSILLWVSPLTRFFGVLIEVNFVFLRVYMNLQWAWTADTLAVVRVDCYSLRWQLVRTVGPDWEEYSWVTKRPLGRCGNGFGLWFW